MQFAKPISVFSGATRELKSPSFWVQRALAHPCCWLPIISGGSVRLFDMHILWLELLIGFALVVVIEEGIRAFQTFKARSSGCPGGQNGSRASAYLVAVPLFIASFALAHYLFPHDIATGMHESGHLHEHFHGNIHEHSH